MSEAGQCQIRAPRSASDLVIRLDHGYRATGLRERNCRGEAVGSGPDDDGLGVDVGQRGSTPELMITNRSLGRASGVVPVCECVHTVCRRRGKEANMREVTTT
jgi:hypothetical protein